MLRLARLAVDESRQASGVGKVLLRFVFKLALRMSSEFGCVSVLVDAKPKTESFYASIGFLRLVVVSGDALFQPVPMFIGINRLRIASTEG